MQRNTDLASNNALEASNLNAHPFDSLVSGSQANQSGIQPPLWKRCLQATGLALGVGISTVVSAIAGTYIALTIPLPDRIAPQEAAQKPTLAELFQKGIRHTITRPVNILVMGIDGVPGAEEGSDAIFSGRSDTMLLIQVNPDPAHPSVSMLSIPRDTQVRFPGQRGVTKINHANAMGGARLAADVVSYNLGDIEIDRYVRFSTEAFRELVDLMGGVEIFVPQPMHYVDQTQGLTIDLEQGLQVLNGDQAEQFARFRSDAYGDIGRVQRQQLLITALRDRLMHPSVIPQIPEIIELLRTHIDTNLSSEEMLALSTFGLDLDQESLQMVMLPGTFSQQGEFVASYWLMDDAGVRRVLQDYFGVNPGSYASDYALSKGLRSDGSGRREGGRSLSDLRIAVQNASHHPQIATQVMLYLQNQGFDRAYVIQDWPDHQDQTQVIVQNGYLQEAAMLEQVLGVGNVVPSSTGDLGSDLTIRVGDDWLQNSNLGL